jgi:hypothetical protein
MIKYLILNNKFKVIGTATTQKGLKQKCKCLTEFFQIFQFKQLKYNQIKIGTIWNDFSIIKTYFIKD